MSKVPHNTDEGFALTTPAQIDTFRLATIKMGLKALQHGMVITRGANAKYLLSCLSQYTGKKYSPRKDVQQGIADIEEIMRKVTS